MAEDREFFYHYDCEGNLVFKEFKELSWGGNVIAPINKERLEAELGIRFRAFGTGWRYDWQSDGMLARVVRPDGKEVLFAYDALGRRIRKTYAGTTTHFVWDGNVPLHEWTEEAEENVVTWLFEQDTFVPAAKLVANGDCFSIVSDYLGTPIQAYDKKGDKVWEQELDIYGRQRKRPSAFIPFKYQGQYADEETGLYYNRFRYYDPNAGSYISQDPIGLAGNNPTLYGYVRDTNSWFDILGLNVFWSGGKAAQKAAEEFARNEGGIRTILENTDLGKAATELADEATAKGIHWLEGGGVAFDMASEEFALNAVSDYKVGKLDSVDVFIDVDNYGKYGTPTWERIEKPILEKNNVPIKEHKFSSGSH